MHTIAVSNLRANLIKILNEIEHGETIDITSRGRVVAKLVPPDYSSQTARKKLEEIRKTAVIHDVISPISESFK